MLWSEFIVRLIETRFQLLLFTWQSDLKKHYRSSFPNAGFSVLDFNFWDTTYTSHQLTKAAQKIKFEYFCKQ